MRPSLADMLTFIIAGTLTLGLLELGVRVLLPPDGADSHLTRYDPVLGWALKANTIGRSRTSEYDVIEGINVKGLRGPSYPYDKPKGTKRVLVLGDSFTEGYAVELKDHFITRMETLLGQGHSSPVEVINMGVAGYSTDQELLLFKAEGARYAPDVTVLMFYYNDVWYNAQGSYWRGCKPRFELKEGALGLNPVDDAACRNPKGEGPSRLLAFVKGLVERNDLLTRALIGVGMKKVPQEFGAWMKSPSGEVEHAWALTEALLKELKARAAEAGSKFIVFYIPSLTEIDPKVREMTMRRYGFIPGTWSPEEVAGRLRAACEAHGIDLVDPTDEMRQAGKPLYFPRDGHWNKDGNALVGEILAGALESL